jgi:hypothetical protein
LGLQKASLGRIKKVFVDVLESGRRVLDSCWAKLDLFPACLQHMDPLDIEKQRIIIRNNIQYCKYAKVEVEEYIVTSAGDYSCFFS